MTRIILATPQAEFDERVSRAFDGRLNGDVQGWRASLNGGDPTSAVTEMAGLSPDLVVIGPAVDTGTALAFAEVFDRQHPEISVVLVAERTAQLLDAAMRVGVREVVSPGAAQDELRGSLERALKTASRLRANLLGEPEKAHTQHAIAVLAPKGGAGKTVMATNLAVALGRAAPRQVALVDLDIQFGDVGHALRIVPEHTIFDAVRAGAELDPTTLKVFLTPHPSNVWVLCGAETPAQADAIAADKVTRILSTLSDAFPYVVMDTGSGLDDYALAAADAATDIVLVGAPDVPSVHSVRKTVEALDLLGLSDRRWHFVLNRSDTRVGLSAKDIEATVGLPIDVSIPSSRQVPISINQGEPILESDDRSPVSRAMYELANRFARVAAPAARSKGRPLFRRSH